MIPAVFYTINSAAGKQNSPTAALLTEWRGGRDTMYRQTDV